ncbi:hypothetical protein AYO38_02990 [bacterium SCGC AG-212-C10]|nr:hypothetical protein AYO38_02990 [bacterium SCGC AG-212-C10]
MAEIHTGHGLGAEEIHAELPHLSLAQIYAALGYYYDHKDAYDKEMSDWAIEYQRLWEADRDSPLKRNLRERGLI